MEVGRLEGAGEPEQAYTLTTEILREELQKTSAVSEVAILREERHDESGQIRRLKTRPELLSVGDKLTLDDLVRGETVIFAATGITPGETLKDVRCFRGGGRTHSVVMCTKPRMIRFIDTIHAPEPGASIQGFQF